MLLISLSCAWTSQLHLVKMCIKLSWCGSVIFHHIFISLPIYPLFLSHYPSLCVCLQKRASTCQTRFHIANVICKLVYTMYFFSPLDQSTPPHNQRIVPRPVSQSVNLSICQLVTLSLCHSISWSVRSLSLCVIHISLLFLLSLMITRWYWHFIVAVCGMWHAARCTLHVAVVATWSCCSHCNYAQIKFTR